MACIRLRDLVQAAAQVTPPNRDPMNMMISVDVAYDDEDGKMLRLDLDIDFEQADGIHQPRGYIDMIHNNELRVVEW